MEWNIFQVLFWIAVMGLVAWLLVWATRRYDEWVIRNWAKQHHFTILTIQYKNRDHGCPRQLSSDQRVYIIEALEKNVGRTRKGWAIFGKYWSLSDDFSLSEVLWQD